MSVNSFCQGFSRSACTSGAGSLGPKFDDPFLLPSSDYVPDSMGAAFDFCRFLYILNPEYRRASHRVTRHFLQDYEFKDLSQEDKLALTDYLDYKLGLRAALGEMGDDWSAYGNAFMRLHFPFKRILHRDKKHFFDIDDFPLDALTFNLDKMKYVGPDLLRGTSTKVEYDFVDIKLKEKDGIRILKDDPRYIDLLYSEYTKEKRFVYRIPSHTIGDVKNNNIFQINNLSRKMLTAIRDKKNILYTENEVFHFLAPKISGISTGGWGLPEPIANFRLLYQIQVYRKLDEVVGLDYMLPFRILSAAKSSGSGEAQRIDFERWKQEMNRIVTTRRKDKTAMFSTPFPVTYEEVGASGKSLTPKDLLEYQINNMLNAMGYPAELYTMSFQTEQAPTAIRLFENSFWFIHEGYNEFVRWTLSRINGYLGNKNIDISIKRPSLADDLDTQNTLLQLGMQGEVSRQTYMPKLGIPDPLAEIRTRAEEEKEIQKIHMEAEEELQREVDAEASLQAALADPQDILESEGGVTPTDKEQEAYELAMQWGAEPDDAKRSQAMQVVKAQDFQLYAMASKILEDIRAQGASEGRQAANQKMQEGGQ